MLSYNYLDPLNYRYCVIEFKYSAGLHDRLVCVPRSWMNYFLKKNQLLVFSYPKENVQNMEELIKHNGPKSDEWRTYTLSPKYCTNSYEDAMNYIKRFKDSSPSLPPKISAASNSSQGTDIIPTSSSLLGSILSSEDKNIKSVTANNNFLITKDMKNEEEILKDDLMASVIEDLNQEKSSHSMDLSNISEKLKQKYKASIKSYIMAKKLSDGCHERCLELETMMKSMENYERINQKLIDITQNKVKVETDLVKRQNNEEQFDIIGQNENVDMEVNDIKKDTDFIDLTTEEETTATRQNIIIDKNIKTEPNFTKSPNIEATKLNNHVTTATIVLDDDSDNNNVETQTHREKQEKGNNSTIDSVTQLLVVNCNNVKEKEKNSFEVKHVRCMKTLPARCTVTDSRCSLRFPNKEDGLQELLKDSSIYVKKNELHKLYECHKQRGNRRSFAASLLQLIFSDVALKQCSMTGFRTFRPSLDKHAVDVMFRYIEWYGNCYSWPPQSRKDILKYLNQRLYVIRKKSNS